jgi:hypothetical protein
MPTEQAKEIVTSDWFDRFARFGYAMKGVVWGLVGFLAIRVALGDREEEPDFLRVFEGLEDQPFKFVMLTVLSVGLTGYAVWRVLQGVLDAEGEGGGLRGWAKRGSYIALGLTYGVFAVYAMGILGGWSTEDDQIRDLTAVVLGFPGGRWWVGLAGAAVMVGGIVELYTAFARRFEVEFGSDRFALWQRVCLLCTGGVGHAARGGLYLAAGFFAIRAAVEFDPEEARGIGETLQEIAAQPFGAAATGLLAVGLMLFGAYFVFLAFHRHGPGEGVLRGEEGQMPADVQRAREEEREGSERKG